jgi:predicted nuclease of predicted toxin-antitoxin system
VTASRPILRFFLDEGVTDSVGTILSSHGHVIIRLRAAIATGSPDPVVCAAAELNSAILVAHDGDMKALAQRHGIGKRRFRTLSLLKLSCRESRAPERVEKALTLIEHEWQVGEATSDRRIFVEIGTDVIRTMR